MQRPCLISIPVLSILLLMHCGHLKDAKQAYQNKNYKKTISLCQQAIQADSSDVPAFILMAQSYRNLKNYPKALQTIVRAKKINPASAAVEEEALSIHLEYGIYHLSKNKKDQAYRQFISAFYIDSTHHELLVHLADLSLSLGYMDKAESLYGKLAKKDSKSDSYKSKIQEIQNRKDEAQHLYEKAIGRYQKQQLKSAKTLFDQALKINKDHRDARYHNYMVEGQLLLKKGSKSALWDAIEIFGKATVLKNDLPEPHFYMAQCYEKKDDDEFVNAIDEYQKALDLDPEGPHASVCKQQIAELTKRKDKLDKFWGKKK